MGSGKSFIHKNTATLRRAARKARLRKQFSEQYRELQSQAPKKAPRFDLSWADRRMQLLDATPGLGFDRHYVYHMAWAARIVADTRPAQHTDISSHVNFCTILSAFVPTVHYEFRLPELSLPGLECRQADLVALPMDTNSVESLSCMHVVEHIGLGRYGDAVDYDGDLKAVAELKRVVAPGGSLLFVVPVGRPRIEFNAHRVYSYELVNGMFAGWELRQFALIPDDRAEGLLTDAPPELVGAQSYACGCFWYIKPGTPPDTHEDRDGA